MRGSDDASHPDSWSPSHGIVLRVSGLAFIHSHCPEARYFPGTDLGPGLCALSPVAPDRPGSARYRGSESRTAEARSHV